MDRQKWMHFCDDPASFALDASAPADQVLARPGIWLYRYTPDRPHLLRRAAESWRQGAVVVAAPEALVESIQPDPLGEGLDEFFLPAEAFGRARIVGTWYPERI